MRFQREIYSKRGFEKNLDRYLLVSHPPFIKSDIFLTVTAVKHTVYSTPF